MLRKVTLKSFILGHENRVRYEQLKRVCHVTDHVKMLPGQCPLTCLFVSGRAPRQRTRRIVDLQRNRRNRFTNQSHSQFSP